MFLGQTVERLLHIDFSERSRSIHPIGSSQGRATAA
jgi:hypothetical protein